MLDRVAHLAIAAPRRVLAVAALLLVAAGILGAPVASHLSSGGFTVSNADSTVATDQLEQHFDGGTSNFIVVVPKGDQAALHRVVTVLEQKPEWAANIVSGVPGLDSKDGIRTLVLAFVKGNDDQIQTRSGWFADHLKGDGIQVGGEATTYHQVNVSTRRDLTKAEAISVPLTALALVLVFGSVVAALTPLAIALLAIVGTLAELRILAMLTDVSIYAMNMTTALGLALAIDYSLFMVSRHREELRRGADLDEAIRTTVRTAGRTVLFSALTVALSLAALAVFPMYFLRSFAYAGLAVVGVAAAASLLVLPALLKVLGPRIDALDVMRRWRRPQQEENGFWYHHALRVMRRPVLWGGAVVVVLVVLLSPFLHAQFGYPDDRVLRPAQSARAVGDELRTDFTIDAGNTLQGIAASAPSDAGLTGYVQRISALDHVTGVTSSAGVFVHGRQVGPAPAGYRRGDAVRFSVTTDVDPFSSAGKQVVTHLRDAQAPWTVHWSGWGAFNLDAMQGLARSLPLALGLIALSTFVVLFLFTGSVVVPLKALVLNMLSLSATMGAMVWVFQDGHLSHLLGFTSAGYLVANMVVLVFCLAFGMSMDYEVFLLSRIREEYAATRDNTRAVALGLARTGRIVTAAAALMAIVFAAMVTSTVQFMQLFGLGLTLAVLTDATLVRGILVPAFMRLMGRANWWAPRPLAWLHDRIGLKEDDGRAEPARPAPAAPAAR